MSLFEDTSKHFVQKEETTMSNFIHYRNFTSNHLARSMIINCSPVRPKWMNNEIFIRNSWPTPAMQTYLTVVSVPFIRFLFTQEPARREI